MTVSRKNLNRQRTIDDIEKAFLSIYKDFGIDGVSTSKICQLCGISRSTFYLYFDDKYAILQAVEDRLLSALWSFCRDLPDLLDLNEGTSIAMETIHHIRKNIDWYRALLGTHGDPMFVYRWKKDIEHSLHRKLIARNISERDTKVRGILFASALIGLYTYVIFEYPEIPDHELCRYMDELLDHILRHRTRQ